MNRNKAESKRYEAWSDGHGFYRVVNPETGRTATLRGMRLSGIGTRAAAEAYAAELLKAR